MVENRKREHPAHFLPVERFNEPTIIELTVCTNHRIKILANDKIHSLLRSVWEESDFWRVGRYMIMPDHIHLFCTPGRTDIYNLRKWATYWRRQASMRLNKVNLKNANGQIIIEERRESMWQRDFWDTQMRSRDIYNEKLAYVRSNPVRKELVKDAKDWPYQGQIFEIRW